MERKNKIRGRLLTISSTENVISRSSRAEIHVVFEQQIPDRPGKQRGYGGVWRIVDEEVQTNVAE